MWLLDSTTHDLVLFHEPPSTYAILSHAWGPDEVTYQQLRTKTYNPDANGWQKIKACCVRARDEGFQYAWVDTCCIDKTNLVELSEAINSMYRWYQLASICYVFLEDVRWPRSHFYNKEKEDEPLTPEARFQSSRWFTRGWTLQELLAPTYVMFVDKEWRDIGTRDELAVAISTASGIRPEHLRDMHGCNIATKMCWAKGRTTTKGEDLAYCLIGLMNVNMPLLYGEGSKRAFQRLLQEIIKTNDDESVLACRAGSGFLASSPADFIACEACPLAIDPDRPDFSLTNKGLSIAPWLWRYTMRPWAYLPLPCRVYRHPSAESDNGPSSVIALQLKRTDEDPKCISYQVISVITNFPLYPDSSNGYERISPPKPKFTAKSKSTSPALLQLRPERQRIYVLHEEGNPSGSTDLLFSSHVSWMYPMASPPSTFVLQNCKVDTYATTQDKCADSIDWLVDGPSSYKRPSSHTSWLGQCTLTKSCVGIVVHIQGSLDAKPLAFKILVLQLGNRLSVQIYPANIPLPTIPDDTCNSPDRVQIIMNSSVAIVAQIKPSGAEEQARDSAHPIRHFVVQIELVDKTS